MNQIPLKPEEKSLLSRFIEDDDELDVIQSAVRLASRRGDRYTASWLAISFVSLFTIYASPFLTSSSFLGDFLIITGICVYFLGTILFACMAYKWTTDSSFRAILGAMQKVDPALQSTYASPERIALARKLIQN